MTGAEPQVSGHPCFFPEVLGGGDEEVTATKGPGLSPPHKASGVQPSNDSYYPWSICPVLPHPSPKDFWASEPWGEITRL